MQRAMMTAASAVALSLGMATSAAYAVENAADEATTEIQADVLPLANWNYGDIYEDGWSAEELIDEADVYGADGDEIGDIEDIIVSEEGKVVALIAEIGGILHLGDTHVMVPWEQVEVSQDLERITVPVNQENAEEYSLYGDTSLIRKAETQDKQVVYEDVVTGPRLWKVTELINDYATLEGGVAYGYVDDVIFGNSGKIEAVVVSTDVGYPDRGLYAYPYYGYGYGWNPESETYELPYEEADVAELEEFDEDRLDD